MLQIIVILCTIALSSTYGHNGGLSGTFQDEALMQADLMPQELNPAFQGKADDAKKNQQVYADLLQIPELPRRPLLPPKPRVRRGAPQDGEVAPHVSSLAEQIKQYSRVITGIVLMVAIVIEIVVYIVEAYQAG
ncbi:hypothetical protein NE865_11060 [Phthorimaea operculella]|nr:hypothetical protein NE865_11060 [Phthorimaea operculella]